MKTTAQQFDEDQSIENNENETGRYNDYGENNRGNSNNSKQSYFDNYTVNAQNNDLNQNFDRNLDRNLDQFQNQTTPSPLQFPSTVIPVYIPNDGTYERTHIDIYLVSREP